MKPVTPGRNPNLLNPREAGAYLGVSPGTLAVWRCNRRYRIPFVKCGSRVFYRRADLDRWLESRLVDAPAEA